MTEFRYTITTSSGQVRVSGRFSADSDREADIKARAVAAFNADHCGFGDRLQVFTTEPTFPPRIVINRDMRH